MTARQVEAYTSNVNFNDLAEVDSLWRKQWQHHDWIARFQDTEFNMQLTSALLRTDFGIKHFELPTDRLCPPVPVRWNYIRFIQRLLDTTSGTYKDNFEHTRKCRGLDIGTGASAIYALLACSSRSEWSMVGTDIDQASLDSARRNVSSNNLGFRISIEHVSKDSPLLPLTLLDQQLDFTVCNPPFYSSESEILNSANSKLRPPSAVCTGSENEMITPGGEAAFVARLLNESLVHKTRVQWYTSMLGKLESVVALVTNLKTHDIDNFAVASLTPGNGTGTKRWAVAWSFHALRPAADVAVLGPSHANIARPAVTEYVIPVRNGDKKAWLTRVTAVLETWDILVECNDAEHVIFGLAASNTWNRRGRRSLKRKANALEPEQALARQSQDALPAPGRSGQRLLPRRPNDSMGSPVLLGFRVTVGADAINLRWTEGRDALVFKSFHGALSRALLRDPSTSIEHTPPQ